MKCKEEHLTKKNNQSAYKCKRCGRTTAEILPDGCDKGPCPLVPIHQDKRNGTTGIWLLKNSKVIIHKLPTFWQALTRPMGTWKYWRQFAIYTVTSVAGMFCTRYIPAEYWPYWFAFSLFIGHVINLFNYAGFKIRWKRKSNEKR